MLTSLRCGDDLTRSTNEELMISEAGGQIIGYHLPNSDKSLKTCNSGGKLIQSLPPGSGATVSGGLSSSNGSDQDVWDCFSAAAPKMARSVVSISLFEGDTNVFRCSGIPVNCNRSYIRVLTSANLAMAMKKRKLGSSMRIQVRDAFGNVAPGCLQHCDNEHGIAFVTVTQFLDVCEVHLRHGVELFPHSDLVAIQFTDSDGAMPVKGVLTKDSSTSEHDELLCKAGDGGPFFDVDGNFVGMNLFSNEGRCAFVQRSVIVEGMEQFEKRNELRASRAYGAFRPRFNRTIDQWSRKGHYVLI